MADISERPVLIVGAGPTGLVLAIELARRQIPVRLVEAEETLFKGARGKGIQPRTLEILDQMGVIGGFLEAGGPYPPFRIHLGSLSFRLPPLGARRTATPSLPWPNLLMVPQSRTCELLLAQFEKLGGKVEFGKRFAAFEPRGSEACATLESGETVSASFIVGCDGGRSTVRKALGFPLEGKNIDEAPLLVADVAMEGLDRDHWHVWPLARGGRLMLCPLPGTNLFQLTGPHTIERDGLEQTVERATGCRVTSVQWKSLYRPQVRMVTRYRAGPVFLAGDAAHLHPPAGGQGLNTGIQDAWNLGWKLASVMRGRADSILDTYEEERLPIAASVLNLSRKLHVRSSLKRGALTDQIGLHYRSSSLSEGGKDGTLLAGDRMPDMTLAGGERLYEKMREPGPIEVIQQNGMHILVRPDGYIARIDRRPHDGDYAGQPVTRITI